MDSYFKFCIILCPLNNLASGSQISFSTPRMIAIFASLHIFVIKHRNGNALAVLWDRTNISSPIISLKLIFNRSIKLVTNTFLWGSRLAFSHVGISLSLITAHQNFALKFRDDLVIWSLFWSNDGLLSSLKIWSNHGRWLWVVVIRCSNSSVMVGAV